MATRWGSRGSLRFVGLWSFFLLLQQFHIVMLKASTGDLKIYFDEDMSRYSTETDNEDYSSLFSSVKASEISHSLTPSKVLTWGNAKKMTTNTGRSIQAKTKVMSRKLKEMGNMLAAKAEKRVKQLEEIQTGKGKIVKRYRRMIHESQPSGNEIKLLKYINDHFFPGQDGFSRKDIMSHYRYLNEETLKKNLGDKIIDINSPQYKQFNSYFDKMKGEIKETHLQQIKEAHSQHSYVYKKVDNKLEKIRYSKLDKNIKITIDGSEMQRHSEVSLSLEIKDEAVADAEDIFWYTKNSPCMTCTTPDGKSCLWVILDRCKNWFKNKLGKCYIKFDEWWGFDSYDYSQLALEDIVKRNQNFELYHFKEHFDTFLQKQKDNVKTYIDSLIQKPDEAPQKINALKKKVEEANKLLDDIIGNPERSYSSLSKNYENILTKLPNSLKSNYKNDWDKMLKEALINDKTVQEYIKTLNKNIFFDGLAKVSYLKKSVDVSVDQLKKSVDVSVDQLKKAVDVSVDQLRKTVDISADQLRKAADVSGNQINKAVDVSVDQLKKAVEDSVNQLKKAVDVSKDKLKDVSEDQLKKAVEGLENQLKKEGVSVDQFKKEMEDSLNQLKKAVDASVDKLKKEGVSVDQLKKEMEDSLNQFKKAVDASVDQLKKGMEDSLTKYLDLTKAYLLIKAADDSVKNLNMAELIQQAVVDLTYVSFLLPDSERTKNIVSK